MKTDTKTKVKGKARSAAIVRRWKRFFGVSCSHAEHINRRAWDKAMEIRKDLKPEFTFHLGDFMDTTAFRSGAAGTADEMANPEADLECGIFHLQMMEPDLVLCGNHEQRLWGYTSVRDAKVASYAHRLISDINASVKGMGAELVEYKGQFQGVMMGPALLTHGTIFNVNAARDMAETYGGGDVRYVMFGHTHTIAVGQARAAHGCTGINIGCLTDRRDMGYAQGRRQTWAWVNACITGEYCDNGLVWNLHELERETVTFGGAENA